MKFIVSKKLVFLIAVLFQIDFVVGEAKVEKKPEANQVYTLDEIMDRVSRAAQYSFGLSVADLPNLKVHPNMKFFQRDLSLWDIKDDKTQEQMSRWNIALKEVKYFVENSGTKDLLCVVGTAPLKPENKTICDKKNISTINKINLEILDTDLPIIIQLIVPEVFKNEPYKNISTIQESIDSIKKLLTDSINGINSVSTYRKGPEQAKTLLLYVFNIYQSILTKIFKDVQKRVEDVVFPEIAKQDSEFQEKLKEATEKLRAIEKSL